MALLHISAELICIFMATFGIYPSIADSNIFDNQDGMPFCRSGQCTFLRFSCSIGFFFATCNTIESYFSKVCLD
uniref:Secreted protein n=1 Tax=Syphacia muris TaxID=451379 RepID=A0A0N5AUH2_9BILA